MNFSKGRDNLSATIHVSTRCKNICRFCVNKAMYNECKPNAMKLGLTCAKIAQSDIDEIVISGGEPTSNIDELEELLEIFKGKIVYINTSLPTQNFNEFVRLVNTHDCVKGINVSRHTESEALESTFLHDVVPDKAIAAIKKPVRINVVLHDNMDVAAVLERWKPYNFTVQLRADFTKTTAEDLHTLKGLPLELLDAEIVERGSCDVCNTVIFKFGKQTVMYHKGLRYTSVKKGNVISVNDVIVYPDGNMYYDWNTDCKLTDVNAVFGSKKPAKTTSVRPIHACEAPASRNTDYTCGGSHGFSAGSTCGVSSSSCGVERSCGGSHDSHRASHVYISGSSCGVVSRC